MQKDDRKIERTTSSYPKIPRGHSGTGESLQLQENERYVINLVTLPIAYFLRKILNHNKLYSSMFTQFYQESSNYNMSEFAGLLVLLLYHSTMCPCCLTWFILQYLSIFNFSIQIVCESLMYHFSKTTVFLVFSLSSCYWKRKRKRKNNILISKQAH